MFWKFSNSPLVCIRLRVSCLKWSSDSCWLSLSTSEPWTKISVFLLTNSFVCWVKRCIDCRLWFKLKSQVKISWISGLIYCVKNLWLKVSNTDSRRAEPELFVDMLKIECRLVWSGVVRTDEGFEWTTFGWWRENFAFKVAKLDFRRLFLGLGEVTRELRSDLVGDREAGVSALETEFGHSILPLRRCGRLYFIFN